MSVCVDISGFVGYQEGEERSTTSTKRETLFKGWVCCGDFPKVLGDVWQR